MKIMSKRAERTWLVLMTNYRVAYTKTESTLEGLEVEVGRAEAAFRKKLDGIQERAEAEIEALKEVSDEINAYAAEVRDDIDSYVDERSEKWQESDAASSVSEWREEWELELDLSEVVPDMFTDELPSFMDGWDYLPSPDCLDEIPMEAGA